MRHRSLVALSAAALLSSCAAGPHQLSRTVDDLDQKVYVDNPWLNALLYVVPVLPVAKLGALVGDFVVTDAYAFWRHDAWDHKGTGFEHYTQEWTDGRFKSLLANDGVFLQLRP